MHAEILLTLKLQQRLFADPRRIELLKQVRHSGSISQGAKMAGISYKSAWDAINEMNQLAEHTLVERMTGGKGGGGARITGYGERLIQLYDLLAQIQQKPLTSCRKTVCRWIAYWPPSPVFRYKPAPEISFSAPCSPAAIDRCNSIWTFYSPMVKPPSAR